MDFLGDERRRVSSRHTTESVQLVAPMKGRVVNLSETGLCVETSSGLPVGGVSTMQITRKSAEALTLAAQVRWCRLVRTVRRNARNVVPVYLTGLELTRLSDGTALTELVD